MRILEIIREAPIQDYDTIGNFGKNSSFRDRDRHLITNPTTIEYVKKKFASTDHPFNLFFVNTPAARKHTEVGKVDMEWIVNNLGDEVAQRLQNATDLENSVNVVFTNNKGTQGKNMTAWIMAHRIAHALARPGRGGGKQFYSYQEGANNLHRMVSELAEYYGRKDLPTTYDKMSGFSSYRDGNRDRVRNNQLFFKHLMTQLCTFRSARENVVRDWFEILHELFAQYITTGKVKFNAPPQKAGTPKTGVYYLKDKEEAEYVVQTMENTMEYLFDDMISEATGSILVM